jgi:hypothetical protein
MNWLEFGRAISAVIVTAGLMWLFVNASTPRPTSATIIVLTTFVAILLGTTTLVERLGSGGDGGGGDDLSVLIDHLDTVDNDPGDNDGEQ